MAITTTSNKFNLVEAASAIAAAKIPFQAGRYIVCDTGEAFYDPSTGTTLANRIPLSPDLSGYLKKNFSEGLIEDIETTALENGIFKITATIKNPQDDTKKYDTFIQVKSTQGSIKGEVDSTGAVDLRLEYGEVDAANTKLPVNGADVKAAIDAAQTASTAKVSVFTVADGVTDTTTLAGIESPKQGDMAILKRLINNNLPDDKKYQYTAYVYNNDAWQAMDGNYSAENVYFPKDLLTTTAVGTIQLKNGQGDVKVAGKNLVDAWETIFVKEDNTGLKTKNPAASIAGTATTYIEVGSSTSKTLTVTLSEDGQYKYGYTSQSLTEGATATDTKNDGSTGVVVNTSDAAPYTLDYQVGSAAASSITASGTNKNQFVIDSGVQTAKQSAKVTATVKYTQGHIPVSNLKKAYPAQRIAAASASASAADVFRWYVPMYYGFTYSDSLIADPANMTAAQITGLGTKVVDANAYNQTKTTSASASKSWRQFFIAVPKSYNWNVSAAKDSNNLTLQVNKKADAVEVTLGTTKVSYDVFYINNAADHDTKTISLTW